MALRHASGRINGGISSEIQAIELYLDSVNAITTSCCTSYLISIGNACCNSLSEIPDSAPVIAAWNAGETVSSFESGNSHSLDWV